MELDLGMGDAAMRQRAEKNWYILFGEPLPTKLLNSFSYTTT